MNKKTIYRVNFKNINYCTNLSFWLFFELGKYFVNLLLQNFISALNIKQQKKL